MENIFSEPSSIFQERAVIFREGTLKFTNIPEKQTQVFEDHVPFFWLESTLGVSRSMLFHDAIVESEDAVSGRPAWWAANVQSIYIYTVPSGKLI